MTVSEVAKVAKGLGERSLLVRTVGRESHVGPPGDCEPGHHGCHGDERDRAAWRGARTPGRQPAGSAPGHASHRHGHADRGYQQKEELHARGEDARNVGRSYGLPVEPGGVVHGGGGDARRRKDEVQEVHEEQGRDDGNPGGHDDADAGPELLHSRVGRTPGQEAQQNGTEMSKEVRHADRVT